MANNRMHVKRYTGGNATIDRLLAEHWPGEKIWMVNGKHGRRPITADSKEDAIARYNRRHDPVVSDPQPDDEETEVLQRL